MTTAVFAETFDAIATLAEEEAIRVARRDQLRRLLERSNNLLWHAELANRDSRPTTSLLLCHDIRRLEHEILGEMTSGITAPQQAVDCLFSLQTVLLDWLEPGYDHMSRKEGHDGCTG